MTGEGAAAEFPGFTRRRIDDRDVWVGGDGPAIIVVHELPGLHPGMFDFARRLVTAGFTVWLPSLFGTPGRDFSAGYLARVALRLCVSREFTVLATGRTSPVVAWLRRLAAQAHAESGGPGVGVVAMCFTGNFALGMAVDAHVLAPVMSQPATPLPLGPGRAAPGVSSADLAAVRRRAREEGLCVMGLRFTADRAVPPERFATLRRALGDNFIAVEIDSSPGNPYGISRQAHSVLTVDLVDEPGHPTRAALDQVIDFFQERLRVRRPGA